MFLLELITTATEGLVEKYKARFDPNPKSDGYIFYTDDYGNGVKCSKEQYDTYVDEFETFVRKSKRLLWWWFVAVLVLYGVVLGYEVFVLGHEEIVNENESATKKIALFILLLPLYFLFSKGISLYKKPSKELGSGHEIGRERQSKEQIIERRLRGASWNIPIFGIFLSSLGLYFDVNHVGGGYDAPYMRYFFIVAIVGFLWFGIRKFRAHGRVADNKCNNSSSIN